MTNYKHDTCCNDYYPHPRPYPEVNQTVLSCGNGTGIIVPVHTNANSQLFNPYVIASVSIDTSEFKKASIKIDFSSVILFRQTEGNALQLTFQLSKVYSCGGKIALGTWNFVREFELGIGESFESVDSFGFTWCECNVCRGCAYYTVELIQVENSVANSATIINPTINALAVGPADC